MNLKKSFELQNYLKNLLDSAILILDDVNNVTTVTQEHMRKKAYADSYDEVIVKPKTLEIKFTPLQIVDFSRYVLSEIENLTKAINEAKHSGKADFDSMIANNNRKRVFLRCLIDMVDIKSRERIIPGYATKFNVDGNQVKYSYDIKEITKIDFDRNIVKKIISDLRSELDVTSNLIDVMELESYVNFETKFEIGEGLEDAMIRCGYEPMN